MTSLELEEYFVGRFEHDGVLSCVDKSRSWFMTADGTGAASIGIFLTDGSKVPDVRQIVGDGILDLRSNGIVAEASVRADWKVVDVCPPEGPRSTLSSRYRVQLECGAGKRVVEVEIHDLARVVLLSKVPGQVLSDERLASVAGAYVTYWLEKSARGWEPAEHASLVIDEAAVECWFGRDPIFVLQFAA